MSEKHNVTINGISYNLPPFTAGQLRRKADPANQKAAEAIKIHAKAIEESRSLTSEEIQKVTILQREVRNEYTELVLAALNNQYPELTIEDVETLTPVAITKIFNEILMLTLTGDNEPEKKSSGEQLTWGETWSHIALATGWTIKEIDNTPWPDVADLLRYMRKNPPTYLLTKWAYFKTEPTNTPTSLEELKQGLMELGL